MTTSEETTIDSIVKRRTGGAVNIRGIRYQMLYSVLQSLRLLLESKASSIRLEGAEDFDYVSLESEDFYVQVKTSRAAKPWSISKLEKPLRSFLEIYRANPTARFVLVVNFVFKNDLQQLSDRQSLSDSQRSSAEEKFHNFMEKTVGASRQESESILDQLQFETIPESTLKQDLLSVVSGNRSIGQGSAAVHIEALVNQFLIWSENRATITKDDLDLFLDQTARVMAQSHPDYDAFGQRLLNVVNWSTDGNHHDFFDGKSTRPDHIGADLDVRRPKWMKQIDDILDSPKSRICILRASSGQGKSTLMYRYAHDYWNHDYVLLVEVIETKQHAANINYYLRERAKLGQPYLVLIDGIDSSTNHWFEVAQECASLGFPMIATVRYEDWSQFGREHVVVYEPLEPYLDLEEAKDIHASLRTAHTLADDAPEPEVAFERIGTPPLLIEYVFLITQGKMLEDRLRDQLQSIDRSQDAAAKAEILRRVSLAHSLGVPLETLTAINNIRFETDANNAFGSLINEYLHVDAKRVSGIHWVRSNHLSRLLHENLKKEHLTILQILKLGAVPAEFLSRFITNALTRPGIEVDQLKNGLVKWVTLQPLSSLLATVEGIFEAGERDFLGNCRPLLEEAQNRSWRLRWMLTTDLAPRAEINSVLRVADVMGERGNEMRLLAAKVPELRSLKRGIHSVEAFLGELFDDESAIAFEQDVGEFGQLLRWCAIAEVRASCMDAALRRLFQEDDVIFSLSISGFTNFSQGAFLYDSKLYSNWYERKQEDILAFLRFHLDCVKIDVNAGELTVEYIVDHLSDVTPNDQSMDRLHTLRSALPFCEKYCSHGIWILPYQLTSSVDGTVKNIPVRNLLPQSDVRLNVIWDELVEVTYSTDSVYHFQEAWYSARETALHYVRRLSQALRRHGPSTLPGELLANQGGGSLLGIVWQQLHRLPPVPSQISRATKEAFNKPSATQAVSSEFARVDAQKWSQSLQNFGSVARRYVDNPDDQTGRLIVINFIDAYEALPALHTAFAEMFLSSPDYFHAERLNSDEMKEYESLAQMLEVAILYPPVSPEKDLLRYVRARNEEDVKNRIAVLSCALATHLPSETSVGLPHDVLRKGLQVVVPFTFSVHNPCNMNPERDAVHAALETCSGIADRFWMIPTYQGYRLSNAGFTIFPNQLHQLANDSDIAWEFYEPHPVDSEILDILQPASIKVPIEHQMRISFEEILLRSDMLIRLGQLISPFAKSINHFDRALAEKHAAKFQAQRNEICGMVDSLTSNIESLFPRSDSDKNHILDVLGAVQSVFLTSNLEPLDTRLGLDMTTYNEIATRFFCSTFD